MKEQRHSLNDFVDGLQRNGRYTFTRVGAASALGLKSETLTKALQRLARVQRICQVQRGFYLIVPIEYASSGAPPADWFIHELMNYIGLNDYVRVLTAAAIHGAAHQRPQEYQVVVPVSHRTVRAGNFRIRFFRYTASNLVTTENRQTYTGDIPVSTPEATALDLVRFGKRIGGVDAVLTVLEKLGESMNPDALLSAARTERVRGIVQRLGWLLDHAGWERHTSELAIWLAQQKPTRVVLSASVPNRRGRVSTKWKVIENDFPESRQ